MKDYLIIQYSSREPKLNTRVNLIFHKLGALFCVVQSSFLGQETKTHIAMAIPLRATTLMTDNLSKINHQQQHQHRIVHAAPKPLWFGPHFLIHHKPIIKALTSSSQTSKRLDIVRAVSASPGAESAAVSDGTANLLDSVQVFDLNGSEVAVSDLWKDRKAVVAFARHFGCVLCRKRADYLAAQKEKMDAASVALVLIGPGSIDQAKTFAEQTKFKGEVYADPSHSSYEALKFVSGVSTTFTPGAGLKIVQAYMEGYRQDWELSFEKETRTRGGWQQGGIIVAGPGKHNISYIHKDKEAGDDPDIEEILTACCSV